MWSQNCSTTDKQYYKVNRTIRNWRMGACNGNMWWFLMVARENFLNGRLWRYNIQCECLLYIWRESPPEPHNYWVMQAYCCNLVPCSAIGQSYLVKCSLFLRLVRLDSAYQLSRPLVSSITDVLSIFRWESLLCTWYSTSYWRNIRKQSGTSGEHAQCVYESVIQFDTITQCGTSFCVCFIKHSSLWKIYEMKVLFWTKSIFYSMCHFSKFHSSQRK
jgi:hypothetical protein